MLDLQTGDRRLSSAGNAPRYVESGHLLYSANGVLQAVPFDLRTRTTAGTPVPVLQQFAMLGGAVAVMDVAMNGTLVYARGSGTSRLPVWVDRDGREMSIGAPAAMYNTPRLSPDGRRLAFFDIAGNGDYDVWTLDLERGTVDRLTTDRGRDSETDLVAGIVLALPITLADSPVDLIFIRRADGPLVSRGSHRHTSPLDWSADGNGSRTPISVTGESQSPP